MILGLKFILIKHRRSNNNKQRCHVCMNRRHRHPATQQKSFKRVKAPQTPRLFDSSSSSSSFSVFLSLNLYLSFSLYKVCVFFFFLSSNSLYLFLRFPNLSEVRLSKSRYCLFLFLCVCVIFFFGFYLFPFCPKHFPSFYDIAIKTLALLFSLSTKPQSPLCSSLRFVFPQNRNWNWNSVKTLALVSLLQNHGVFSIRFEYFVLRTLIF